MNQQVKARLSAVRDFLAGRSAEAKPATADDQDTRKAVGAELLAAMSLQGEGIEQPAKSTTSNEPETALGAARALESTTNNFTSTAEQERARKLFEDHGYFDEAVENLRGAKSPTERASAARALGLFRSQRGTPHLIAAMFDEDASVRTAAEEALEQIGDPTVTESAVDAALIQDRAQVEEDKLSKSFETTEPVKPVMSFPADADTVEVLPLTEARVEEPVVSADLPDSEAQLVSQESEIRESIQQLAQQIAAAAGALKKAENEVVWRIERETKLRAEAVERRREEETLRRQAEQEAEKRRAQELQSFANEQSAREAAEAEAHRHAELQTNLQLETGRLRAAAEAVVLKRLSLQHARETEVENGKRAELIRVRDDARANHEAELKRLSDEERSLQAATNEVATQQANLKAAREQAADEFKKLTEEQAAVEAHQRAEAERLRQEAEERNRQAEEQLQAQLQSLREVGDQIASRRTEIEAARAKADAESERLVEVLARMRTAEEARAQAEQERAKREAEINEQLETQRRLLAETQRRGEEEKAHLQEELRREADAEEKRLQELESIRLKAENESKQRAEKERQVLSQIDSLRIADAETRKRITDAEARRHSADEAYRLVAEKVQRIEAEAHARKQEEERIIAKLESERRTVAIEAQARAEQEKRIKEEIEMFRRLEDQERPRIEEASLQLAEAEARLAERREQLKADEEARLLAEERLSRAPENRSAVPEDTRDTLAEAAGQPSAPRLVSVPHDTVPLDDLEQIEDTNVVPPAITTYLNSVDPYKRAAAVAELARSGGEDAFGLIVNCFDDHSPHVRNAAARAFRKLDPTRTVDLFNRSLEGASQERRRNIGSAIAGSGLATDAIENLQSENREDTYNALSILFVMAKTGEVEPLVRAIETHDSVQVRMAAIKLLTLTGQPDLANNAAKKRLDKNPPEIDHLI